MTVIVYRDGIMAADTATFAGDLMVAFDTRKIKRTSAGCLVACCGESPMVQTFHNWAEAGFPDPPKGKLRPEPAGALVVNPEGEVWAYKPRHVPYRLVGEWFVEGSHEEFLRGVLAAGATAEEAVRLAIKYGIYAGGDVQVERLHAAVRVAA